MNLFQGLLLSFIQAATEFLPISSSGHLLFIKGLLHYSEIPLIYDILMHGGSLVAVCCFYFSKIRQTFGGAYIEIKQRQPDKQQSRFLIYIIISSVVTFAGYLIFKNPIESGFESPSVLQITFLVTTLILLSVRFFGPKENRRVSEKAFYFAIIVGLFQALAILPGISRSGTTISVMLLFGIKREEAAYYSFMLFIPAVLGAVVFKLSDISSIHYIQANWFFLILAFLSAFGFSYLFLSLLVWIIRHGRLWMFAFYTFILAGVAWILF
ncbi:undecaprenyl-diphosphate phosphatase [bacterium]|nr:undecaprenyl-diphosphate phosphatase [bacterium]